MIEHTWPTMIYADRSGVRYDIGFALGDRYSFYDLCFIGKLRAKSKYDSGKLLVL